MVPCRFTCSLPKQALTLVLLLAGPVVSFTLNGKAFSAADASEVESRSNEPRYYDWSTAQPVQQAQNIDGIVMPKGVLVRPFNSSIIDEIWPPGTFFSREQWRALTGETTSNETAPVLDRRSNAHERHRLDPNGCGTPKAKRNTRVWQKSASSHLGLMHRQSEMICMQKSGQPSFTATYDWSSKLDSGPALTSGAHNTFVSMMKKMGLKIGGPYKWETVKATRKNDFVFEPGTRAAVWHQPHIALAHVSMQLKDVVETGQGVVVCWAGSVSTYSISINKLRPDGQPEGIWGGCYFKDASLCGFSGAAPHPKGKFIDCPKGLA